MINKAFYAKKQVGKEKYIAFSHGISVDDRLY